MKNQSKIDYINMHIIFSDHIITMESHGTDAFNAEELEEIAAFLSVDGDIREHAAQLRSINNDGTWGARRIS